MSAGEVLLRLPRGAKTYEAGLAIQPRSAPPSYSVGSPRKRQGKLISSAFVFVGFHPKKLVNMEFVREKHHRIRALGFNEKLAKISRPPAGHVCLRTS